MNIQSRARRILRRLGSYRSIEDVGYGFQSLRAQSLLDGATPIGVYVNDASAESSEALLISDLGVLVESKSGSYFIAYKDIERVSIVAGDTILETDPSKMLEADGLLITMTDSATKLIPVRNGKGKYRDVFEFSRFMNRAVADVRAVPAEVA